MVGMSNALGGLVDGLLGIGVGLMTVDGGASGGVSRMMWQ